MHLQANETTNLIDLPFVFLSDRLNWGDFKKAIHECGLIWGLPEWMTTITYKGIEWHSLISEHQVDLNTLKYKKRKLATDSHPNHLLLETS